MLGLKSLAIPGAMSAAVVLLAYAGVLWREQFSRASALLFGLGALIAARQATLVVALSSADEVEQMHAQGLAVLSAVWLPAVLYHVVAEILGEAPRRRYSIALVWALSALFALLTLTPLMLGETARYGWGSYCTFGPAGVAFAACSVALSSLCMRMAWNGWRRSAPDTVAALRGRYLFLACCLGALGNIDHLPRLGIGVFPFGGVLSALAALVIAWTATRYRLVEITPAFAAREFMDTMSDGVAVVDPEGVVRLVNPALMQMLGYGEGELLHAQPPAAVGRLLYGDAGGGAGQVKACVGQEREYEDPLGQKRTLSVSISLMRDGGGKLQAVLVTIRDITQALEARERIERLAYYDPLTNLPNRVLLEERFGQAIARAERAGAMAAVLYLDLDRFKHVNDTLGHAAGDRLLQVVSERIAACVRESDLVVRNADSAHDATLARLGGDEFVLLLSPIERGEDAAKVAMRVLQALSQPVEVGAGSQVGTGVSIGIALYPDDGKQSEVLMKRADLAMYHAKQAGRNTAHFFDEGMNIRTRERMDNESSLRRALERYEILLRYQPMVDARSGVVTGLAARVFWDHAKHGLLPEREFRTLAQDTGLAVPLGEWVFHTACMQARAWDAHGLPGLQVAVHASPALLERADIVETVRAALADSGLPAPRLLVGIHAPAARSDRERTAGTIDALAALGVKLVLDDYGSGDLHPAMVLAQPVDTVHLTAGEYAACPGAEAALGAGLIGFARGAGLEVIVDAVADPADAVAWRERGADVLIGPAFGDAVAAEDVVTTLEALAFRRRTGALFAQASGPGRQD